MFVNGKCVLAEGEGYFLRKILVLVDSREGGSASLGGGAAQRLSPGPPPFVGLLAGSAARTLRELLIDRPCVRPNRPTDRPVVSVAVREVMSMFVDFRLDPCLSSFLFFDHPPPSMIS